MIERRAASGPSTTEQQTWCLAFCLAAGTARPTCRSRSEPADLRSQTALYPTCRSRSSGPAPAAALPRPPRNRGLVSAGHVWKEMRRCASVKSDRTVQGPAARGAAGGEALRLARRRASRSLKGRRRPRPAGGRCALPALVLARASADAWRAARRRLRRARPCGSILGG